MNTIFTHKQYTSFRFGFYMTEGYGLATFSSSIIYRIARLKISLEKEKSVRKASHYYLISP